MIDSFLYLCILERFWYVNTFFVHTSSVLLQQKKNLWIKNDTKKISPQGKCHKHFLQKCRGTLRVMERQQRREHNNRSRMAHLGEYEGKVERDCNSGCY